MQKMEVIIFESEAYYGILREIHSTVKQAISEAYRESVAAKKQKETWLTPAEAMKELKIKSKNKLIGLRKAGHLGFSFVGSNYRYSLSSIEKYLKRNSFGAFCIDK